MLTLSRPAGDLGQLSFARFTLGLIGQVMGCSAVGYPRWKMTKAKRRLAAQVDGYVPTAEGTEAGTAHEQHAAFLTLVGERIPVGAPSIPLAALHDKPLSPWGGMSGAAAGSPRFTIRYEAAGVPGLRER